MSKEYIWPISIIFELNTAECYRNQTQENAKNVYKKKKEAKEEIGIFWNTIYSRSKPISVHKELSKQNGMNCLQTAYLEQKKSV